MPTINLSLPVSATMVTAGLHSSNYAALQTLLNGGLDTNNISPTAGITAGQLAAGVGAPTTYRKITAKAVNTTVAATDLLNGEVTVAAGAMSTNKMLRITIWGDWLQNSGGAAAAPRLQLLLGATTIFDTGAPGSATNSATRHSWVLSVEILNLTSGTQAAKWDSSMSMLVAGAAGNNFTTGTGRMITPSQLAIEDMLLGVAINTASVDTTTSKALVLNVINGSASASYETKLLGAVIEVV